jgi:hypothetical protein
MECPICHCHFDSRIHRWTRARAAKGRIAGHLWNHQRPDNGKPCNYIDSGAADSCTSVAATGKIMAINQRDAPDEVRMAG